MFKVNEIVRYSEIGSDGRISLGAILDAFQNTSNLQSESLGLGINYLKQKNIAWVLSAWQVIIEKRPVIFDEITVGTKAYDFKGMYGYRNFCILDDKEDMIVKANSIWVLIDTETGRPMKVSEEESLPYGSEEKIEMEYADRKIKIDGIPEEKEAFPVRKYCIDTNGHVNNAQYVRMAEEYLPDGYEVHQIRVEYKNQAKYGNLIFPVVYLGDEKVIVVLNNEEGKAFAVVEFSK